MSGGAPTGSARRSTFRRVLAVARPDVPLLAAATALLVTATVAGLAYPQGIRLVIDAAVGGQVDRIALIAVAMLAIAVVQGLAAGGRSALFEVAAHRIGLRVRQQVYEHLLALEIAFFDQRRPGELTSTLGHDTTVLQWSATTSVALSIRHGATVIGGIALLLYTSANLTGVMLAVVPAVAIGAVLYGRRVQRLSRAAHDALGDANAMADEALGGIRTVRSFSAEATEAEWYRAALGRAYRAACGAGMARGRLVGTGTMAVYGAAAVVLWFGGRLLARGELTPGALTSFLVYTLIVAVSLQALSDEWGDALRTLGAAERVFALLDRSPGMPTTGGHIVRHVRGEVRFDAVSFRYPSRPEVEVLDAVTFSIAPGEVVALVGPSGSGKSTIAALLGRLYDPITGGISLDGSDIRSLEPAWLRRQVGVVSQDTVLFATTVKDNIAYGRLAATDAEIVEAARLANAHDFISSFPQGYDTQVGSRGVQLSGGQRQRIAIARAFLKNAPVLILDEATSALDAESELYVRQALGTLIAGRATLVIAHRLSTVTSATRIVVLEDGRVVQEGTHQELVSAPGPYRRVVERQLVAS